MDNTQRMAINNRNIASIHGTLWELMHKLNSDRCFIIQPHPEQKHVYLSVAYEVDRKGVSQVKDFFQNVPISDMARFVKEVATTVWIYWDDVPIQVSDTKAQSMMITAGTKQLILRQLVDVNQSWIGTLVVENIDVKEYDIETTKEHVTHAATSIQYILPPIN
jgi:hypothetical protein